MPHSIPLITTLASALGLALFFGFVAARLKLPALVGYLLAGILIGPFTPGFVADVAIAGELAEIGVMLLMFGVGLHFSLDDLLAVRRIAVPGAVLQIAVATALGFGLAYWWGWGVGGALVFGLALSVASTVVLLRALEAHGTLESMNGRIAVGWLVVEDLAMVLVLVLLPPLASWLGGQTAQGAGAPDPQSLWRILGATALQVGGFVALMLVIGRRVFPKILWIVARTGTRELFTAVRDRRGGQHRVRGVQVVRGVVRARRLLCRHGHARVGIQPSRGRRILAAARCVRGAVLRLGRHAVRPESAGRASAASARGGRHHHHRQIDRGGHPGAGLSLSAQYRAHGLGQSGANRRVLVHPRGPGREPGAAAGCKGKASSWPVR